MSGGHKKVNSAQKELGSVATFFLIVLILSVPYPDVFWYRLNGMGAQKKVLVTLFQYIFHLKTK